MQHLHEVRATLGDHAEDLESFLRSLTAASDYGTFLQVMQNETMRQQERCSMGFRDALGPV